MKQKIIKLIKELHTAKATKKNIVPVISLKRKDLVAPVKITVIRTILRLNLSHVVNKANYFRSSSGTVGTHSCSA